MKNIYQLILLPVLLLTTEAQAEENLQVLDKFIEDYSEQVNLDIGTAVAVVKDGKIIYQGYFGHADQKAKKRVDQNTAFYIASMTKSFFALSTLLMEHDGDINESTSMAELFPNLSFPQIDPETVTVKHLLSHTSGIDNEDITTSTAYSGLHSNAILRQQIANVLPDRKHGLGDYNYTNMGYNILSVWADRKYAQDWQKTLAERVFGPLQMNNTSAYMSDAKRKGYVVAKPYSVLGSSMSEPYYLTKLDNTMHAAGGMISTAPDLARFLIAQLDEGQIDGKQIFPAEVIAKSHNRLASTKNMDRGIRGTGYGWGWEIGEYKNEIVYSHGGGFVGARTHMSFIPAHNIGLVVLANNDLVGGRLSGAILDIAYSSLLEKGDVDAIAKVRFEKLLAAKTRTEQKVRERSKTIARRPMVLTQDRAEYAGIFSNTLLGEIEVDLLKSKQLNIRFGNMRAIASGYTAPNQVRVDLGGTGKILKFDVHDEEVVGLTAYGRYFKKD